jgi:hypothetical protein
MRAISGNKTALSPLREGWGTKQERPMPSKTLLAALLATFALPAMAQTAPPPAGDPAPMPDAAAPDTAEAARPAVPPLKTGTPVKDAQGQVIGTVASTSDAAGGPMAVLNIDGKPIVVPRSTLVASGPTVVSTQTKAQILDSATSRQ